MSDRLRMTGLASGMDTQSIVEQLVEAQSYKKTNLKNEQTKLGWKQEAWKSLNSKIYSFYTNKLGEMRYDAFFNKKKASIVDSSIATVSADGAAVNGVQTLAVKSLAKSEYITGGKIEGSSSASAASQFLDAGETEKTFNIKVGSGDNVKNTEITITADMNMSKIASEFAKAGINASYDEKNQRFFLSAKESGLASKFTIEAKDESGNYTEAAANEDSFLNKLKLVGSDAKRIEASDAVIELNGAEFSSSSNNFNINGLSITAAKVSDYTEVDGEKIYTTTNVSTETDVDGIYDSIKDFLKEYNELVNEMSKLYNAESARDYKPLTDEEKESMSDEEVEKWETKIKDSLLRRDDNLRTALDTLRNGLADGVDIDGQKFTLSSFGIGTLSYFEAADNEKYALHIDGNKDDTNTASNTDLLRSAITDNLDQVRNFFKNLTGNVYKTMTKQMQTSEYRSVYSMYDDKALQKEYDKYTEDIKKEEERVSDYEDKWYDKFAAMESAMEKMNSKSNALAGLMGIS